MGKKSFQSEEQSYNPEHKCSPKSKSIAHKKQVSSKNLLKNLVMPIIDFLEENNMTKILDQLKIDKKALGSKNSVSTQIIYKILTHPQVKAINKHDLKIYIANKIQCSSKITKKEYHIKVSEKLMQHYQNNQLLQFKKFKSWLSKTKEKISKSIKKYDHIFNDQSLIVYILNLFYNHFKLQPNYQQLLPSKMRRDKPFKKITKKHFKTQRTIQDLKQFNQKGLKSTLKKIAQMFNNQKFKSQNLKSQHKDFLKILQVEKQKFIKKYQIFNSRFFTNFNDFVVLKCLNKIIQQKKLSVSELQRNIKLYLSSVFHQNIQQQQKNQYQQKNQEYFQFIYQKQNQTSKISGVSTFSPVILIHQNNRFTLSLSEQITNQNQNKLEIYFYQNLKKYN